MSCVSQLEFSVLTPEGAQSVARPTGTSDPREGSGFEAIWQFRLGPGDRSDSCWVVLNQFVNLTTAGTYRLTIHFRGNAQTTGGSPLEMTRIVRRDITVLPVNDDALDRLCRALLSEVHLPLVDRRMRAAAALSYVNDPIAVPHLQEAAEMEWGAHVEIEGLVRIGGLKARAASEALSHSSNPATAAMAHGGLMRIK